VGTRQPFGAGKPAKRMAVGQRYQARTEGTDAGAGHRHDPGRAGGANLASGRPGAADREQGRQGEAVAGTGRSARRARGDRPPVVVVRAVRPDDAADQAEALVRAWIGANDNRQAEPDIAFLRVRGANPGAAGLNARLWAALV
jgi:hypothetical protein